MSDLHRRWDDLPEDNPLPLVLRRRVIGEHMMVSRVVLLEGCDVALHDHENEQIAIVLSGRVRFTLGPEGEQEIVVAEADSVVHLPPGHPHAAYALEDSIVLDLFSPPSGTTGVDELDATEESA